MVAHHRTDPRLLPGRRRRRPPLLAVSRRALRPRDRRRALVRARFVCVKWDVCMKASVSYAELAVTTNFSFLRGASHPQEMVAAADALGLAAIGIADRNSFAGVVRAYDEARKRNVKLLVGTRLVTTDGFETLAYPTDRKAYGRLCRLLTQGNRRARKGECHLTFAEILDASDGQIFIAMPPPELFSDDPKIFSERLAALADAA